MPAVVGFLLVAASLSAAQNARVNVTVAVDKPVNTLTVESMGIYTDMYDAGITKPAVAQYLHAAGIYTIVYPGGYGSYADLYHWTLNSGVKYENANPQPDRTYAAEASMAHIAHFMDNKMTALITVDYGSNMAGTGGGEPAEAAAWVAYANGDPQSTVPLGKDSTGQDWHTVGYWASLRASAPLDKDDGLNSLRAGHPAPLGIKLWQIGSEVYNNGYYVGHSDEEDLHAPYNDKRRRNPNLSPGFYGERLVEFSKAMKAVDPTVWIGASMTIAPIDNTYADDWNPEVLKAACNAVDFEAVKWQPDARLAPDYQTRDDDGILHKPQDELGKILSEVIYNNKKYCPAGHFPRLAFTQMSPIHWAKMLHPITDALFAADAFALLAESGIINSDWVELHDPLFLGPENKPGPAYYGAQMLHIVAFRPGDEFLTVSSSSSAIAAHATKRIDGGLGVILINKDNSNAMDVRVTVNNGSYATQGTKFDYGPENLKTQSGVSKAPFKADGMTFTVTVPAYSIADIVLPKAN